jgi:hypothetical protein
LWLNESNEINRRSFKMGQIVSGVLGAVTGGGKSGGGGGAGGGAMEIISKLVSALTGQ